jgi:hypothetical protein
MVYGERGSRIEMMMITATVTDDVELLLCACAGFLGQLPPFLPSSLDGRATAHPAKLPRRQWGCRHFNQSPPTVPGTVRTPGPLPEKKVSGDGNHFSNSFANPTGPSCCSCCVGTRQFKNASPQVHVRQTLL